MIFKSLSGNECQFEKPSELFIDAEGQDQPRSVRTTLFGQVLGEASLARKKNLEMELQFKVKMLIYKYQKYLDNLQKLMDWLEPTAKEQLMEKLKEENEKLSVKKTE